MAGSLKNNFQFLVPYNIGKWNFGTVRVRRVIVIEKQKDSVLLMQPVSSFETT